MSMSNLTDIEKKIVFDELILRKHFIYMYKSVSA